MSVDLRSQLARYGSQLREDRIEMDVEDAIRRDLHRVPGGTKRDGFGDPWVRGWLIAAAAFLVVILVGVIPILQMSRPAATEDTVLPLQDLGVFEPIRGRVVYVVDGVLTAIDPADPENPVTLEIPSPDEVMGAGPGEAVPVGWSQDGTTLALEDERNGQSYLMDRSGQVTRVPWEIIGAGRGCCYFATANWLAPDGSSVVASTGEGGIGVLDLANLTAGPAIELDPSRFERVEDYGLISFETWSPDGSKIAFVADRVNGEMFVPTIQLWDLESGDVRELAGDDFGHIRNLAWSKDGSQLLVVAGDLTFSTGVTTFNPLAHAVEADIYLLGIDGSAPRRISTGHFVAAAWSPDGSQFAAIEYGPDTGRDVVVMNADGSGQREIASLPSLFTGVAWHPVP